MKIQAESTDILISLDGVPCRVWNAVTENDEQLFLFVHRVATPADLREVIEVEAPRAETLSPEEWVRFDVALAEWFNA